MTSLSDRINAMNIDEASKRELRELFVAVLADIGGVRDDLVATAAKLDDDATVTDTDYEASLTASANLTE